MDKEGALERFQRSEQTAKDRLGELEKDRKDLADEYVTLKSNYLALNKEHGLEVSEF
jgi:predicted  nucleic acid-binding Zn-ribbon protein